MSTDGAGAWPRDCWYAVAGADEVGAGALVPRRVLGRELVLFRTRGGEVAALEDRCAHRALPLSLGRLDGDHVVCRYHGFAYDPGGACVLVPSQEHVPYGAQVASFPVRESGSLVWVWPGDVHRAASGSPPRLPQLEDPAWAWSAGTLTVDAGYLLLHEVALDRTHFAFVHPDTSHRGYLEQPPPLDVEVTETSVSYARTFPPAPVAPWQAAAIGVAPDARCVQRESGVFVSPALHVDRMEVETPDGRVLRTVFVRAFTPVDEARTLVHWRVARDWARGDAAVEEALQRVHLRTVEEDRPLLEALQAAVSRDAAAGVVRRDVNVEADVAVARARDVVRRMLAEEGRPAGVA